MRIILHDVLRVAQHDIILNVVFEIPPPFGRGISVVELHFICCAVKHRIAAIGINQNAIPSGRPHEWAAGIALLPGLNRSGRIVSQELPVPVEAGVAAQSIHILSCVSDKTDTIVKYAAVIRFPEQNCSIRLFHGHSARISLDGYPHRTRGDGNWISRHIDLRSNRSPNPVRVNHRSGSAGGNSIWAVVYSENVIFTHPDLKNIIPCLRPIINSQCEDIPADCRRQHIAKCFRVRFYFHNTCADAGDCQHEHQKQGNDPKPVAIAWMPSNVHKLPPVFSVV